MVAVVRSPCIPRTSDTVSFLRPDLGEFSHFPGSVPGSPGLAADGRIGLRAWWMNMGEGRANNALPESRPSGMYS